MPDDQVLSLLADVNKSLQHFHQDFKSSMTHLIDTLRKYPLEANQNVAATTTPTNTAASQLDLFSTQPREIPVLVFPSDEAKREDEFNKTIKLRIDSVKAEWKNLVNTFGHNTHKSLRNSGLSSLYRDWLERDTPYVTKIFRPTPSNPPDVQIDSIRRQQAFTRVEACCKEMDLYAKAAQKKLQETEEQMKALIERLTYESKERDALFRQWNTDKTDAEQREIRKWEKKMDRLQQYPQNPTLEEEDQNQKDATSEKTSPKNASSKSNEGKKPRKPHAPAKKAALSGADKNPQSKPGTRVMNRNAVHKPGNIRNNDNARKNNNNNSNSSNNNNTKNKQKI